MERHKPENQGEEMDEGLRELIYSLSEATGDYLPVEYVDGTYEIEADHFTLTFTADDEIFEIRSIDVRGNTGLGHQIVGAINEYADENGLEVTASNVKDTAHGFWEKMGFQAGDTSDKYFRAV
jgi:GNAT superfamily N-acetyltransferase